MGGDSVLRKMSKLPSAITALVAALGVTLCHCGKTAEPQADAGTTGDAAIELPGSDDAGADAQPTDASPDAGSTLDAAPPVVSCAMDASVCETLPASTCADAKTVLFFGEGLCVNGSCTWKQSTMPCGPQSYCVNGGCTPPTTK